MLKKSVFLKLLIVILAIATVAVIISQIANKNKFSSNVEETEYDVSPPTVEQT